MALPDALTSRPQPVYPLRMVSNWYKQFMAEAGVEVGSHKGEKRPPGPAMDLKNMRENGVRSLRVHCLHCGIERTVNVDDQPEHLTVKSFERRMACVNCGGQAPTCGRIGKRRR